MCVQGGSTNFCFFFSFLCMSSMDSREMSSSSSTHSTLLCFTLFNNELFIAEGYRRKILSDGKHFSIQPKIFQTICHRHFFAISNLSNIELVNYIDQRYNYSSSATITILIKLIS